ncbi:hypothetical protein, partial [Salmonella sp. s54395]|uniref:WAP domain-containing protein n=1 Tax=Salmonella sp. s54395 TaxID=3159664 RepID=UPI0039812C50
MKYLVLLCLAVGAIATATVERPGVCPNEVVIGDVQHGVCNEAQSCDTDAACIGNVVHKCCDTTCGKKCILPILPEITNEEETKTREEITELLNTILSERRDLVKKLDIYPPPLARFMLMKNRTDVVRMCVITPCELRKCQRIAQIMTYKVTPRKEWYCQLATSTEQCLFWAERGWTD